MRQLNGVPLSGIEGCRFARTLCLRALATYSYHFKSQYAEKS